MGSNKHEANKLRNTIYESMDSAYNNMKGKGGVAQTFGCLFVRRLIIHIDLAVLSTLVDSEESTSTSSAVVAHTHIKQLINT